MMTAPGADNGAMLGAGVKQPTCWQTFGFDGPTNHHNIEQAYRQRANEVSLGGIDPARQSVYLLEQYRECLNELEATQH